MVCHYFCRGRLWRSFAFLRVILRTAKGGPYTQKRTYAALYTY